MTPIMACSCGAFEPGLDVQCLRCGGWGKMTSWAPASAELAFADPVVDVDLCGFEWIAVRPPGFWPWAVDQLLDAKNAVRRRTRRVARPLTELAHRQIERHGVSCAGCGLGDAFRPALTWDGAVCSGCGRRVTGLQWAAVVGIVRSGRFIAYRPIRTWLWGA